MNVMDSVQLQFDLIWFSLCIWKNNKLSFSHIFIEGFPWHRSYIGITGSNRPCCTISNPRQWYTYCWTKDQSFTCPVYLVWEVKNPDIIKQTLIYQPLDRRREKIHLRPSCMAECVGCHSFTKSLLRYHHQPTSTTYQRFTLYFIIVMYIDTSLIILP